MIFNNEMLSKKIIPIINYLKNAPLTLKKKMPDMIKRLQSQGNQEAEGTGNKVTNHEAAFGSVLEEFGFNWIPKNKKNDHLKNLPKEGYYYIYQANGAQASIDFVVMFINNGIIQESYKIDCKYSTSEKIMLNDGWFEADVLYLITWTSKKEVKFLIGNGTLFTTEEENQFMREIRKKKTELNLGTKNIGNLNVYWRCANKYNIKGFTDDFIKHCINKTISSLQTEVSSEVLVVDQQVSEAIDGQ